MGSRSRAGSGEDLRLRRHSSTRISRQRDPVVLSERLVFAIMSYNLDLSTERRKELRMNKTPWVFFIASAFLLLGACSSSRAPVTESPDRGSATTVFGDELSLTGYSVGIKNGHTEVTLRWNVLRKPSVDYQAFVHALDDAGAVAFQGDHPLKNATGTPTSAWAAGDSVEDRFMMAPPANRSPGSYTLRMGVWDPKTTKFLKVLQTNLPQPTDGWRGRVFLIEKVDCK